MSTAGKVFILESPGPVDLLAGRAERFSLERVCKLFGHHPISFLLRDQAELKQTLLYVSSIVRYPKPGKSPLFLHISLHGDGDSISVGTDDVPWKEFARMISQAYKNLDEYEGPIILIISACGGSEQKLTWLLSQRQKEGSLTNPPEYILVFSDFQVDWRDAVVTWTMFYRKIGDINFNTYQKREIKKLKRLIKKIKNSGFGTLTYFRWNGQKYERYPKESSR